MHCAIDKEIMMTKIVQFQVRDDTIEFGEGESQKITSIYALDENGQLWTCFVTADGQERWRAIKMPDGEGPYIKQHIRNAK